MNNFEKMISGKLFDGSSQEVHSVRTQASLLLQQINHNVDIDERSQLFKQLFNSIGTSYVMPPFHCEFGQTITIGEQTFINMNAIMLDGAPITIGNHVLIGPSVQIYTASHSLDYKSRRRWETLCKPVIIEDDVWIGGNCIINQGVTIGARSVVAANSVVNADVPPDSLYAGTPAKFIRTLDHD